jgi:hypothetical protein
LAIEAVAEIKRIEFDEVTELPVMEFLNFLSFIKDRNNFEAEKIRNARP